MKGDVPWRKLPKDHRIIERLYWIDEWSGLQIGKRYRVSKDAVYGYLKRRHVPLRSNKPRARRECPEFEYIQGKKITCGRPVCQIKVWRNDKYYWKPAGRCAYHWNRYFTKLIRENARRRRGTKNPRGPTRYRGRSREWVREM